jgi:malonyl CoA-acyl carrier protein transacylase
MEDKRYDEYVTTISGEIFDELLTYMQVELNLYFTKNSYEFGTKVGDSEITTIPWSHGVDMLYNDINEGKLHKTKKIVNSKNILSKVLKSIWVDCLECFKNDPECLKEVTDLGPINQYYDSLIKNK